MKKAFKVSLLILGSIAGALALMIIVSSILYSPRYIWRVLSNGESKITDYRIFPERTIAKSSQPYHYAYALDEDFKSLPIQYKYLNGYDAQSVETSFSSVKSLDSLMIGMTIEDGYIQSVQQSISESIPEFRGTRFGDITLENLLMMRSKIRYEEGLAWFTDDAKTYYMPDLRDLALNRMKIDENYAGQFHYNNYHPLLLGIILERATGTRVADYFQRKIWDKIGAEHDASWSLDSDSSGFEKMESGLNFYSIDYAKIGSMLLHGGEWNGNAVINENWIEHSTIAPEPPAKGDTDGDFLKDKNVGYQYMWYSTQNAQGGSDFFSAGKYGQYIYVSPENDTVVVRTGADTGAIDWRPDVFRQMAEFAGKS